MHQIGNGIELELMKMHELCSSDGHKKILTRNEIKKDLIALRPSDMILSNFLNQKKYSKF